jgi:hypothetical protein
MYTNMTKGNHEMEILNDENSDRPYTVQSCESGSAVGYTEFALAMLLPLTQMLEHWRQPLLRSQTVLRLKEIWRDSAQKP